MASSLNDKIQFDFNADFGDSNYKSCFARSCVVNSQFHTKSLDLRQLQKFNKDFEFGPNTNEICTDGDAVNNSIANGDILRRKEPVVPVQTVVPQSSLEDTSRRMSCCSSHSSSGGRNSRRGSDLPVANLALQSQVDTLEWQLKQAEASRQMYRAVMQQVVNFLERAHRSLDLLSEKQRVVQRSRSEYHVAEASCASNLNSTTNSISSNDAALISQQNILSNSSADGYATFRDFTWRRPKRQQTSPDEIPPEKLSQEAFRLLRTAQSLLNTREPDLAHVSQDLDQEFIAQLAKEFPSRPQRATSFSINPQLINPADRDIRISTAFNRKLSLQRTPNENNKKDLLKRSIDNEFCFTNGSSFSTSDDKGRCELLEKRHSISSKKDVVKRSIDNDYCLSNGSSFSSTNDKGRLDLLEKRNSISSKKDLLKRTLDNDYCLSTGSSFSSNEDKGRFDLLDSKRNSITSISSKKNADKLFEVISSNKSASPTKTGSVSSAEDESGFSSMNSFQEVGLPLVNSTLLENELKHGDVSVNSSDSNITQINLEVLKSSEKITDKSKLIWNRSDLGLPLNHRRWSSTPVEVQNDPLKVLWV